MTEIHFNRFRKDIYYVPMGDELVARGPPLFIFTPQAPLYLER